MVATVHGLRCNFCGKKAAEVANLILGNGNVAICNECVAVCNSVIAEMQEKREGGEIK